MYSSFKGKFPEPYQDQFRREYQENWIRNQLYDEELKAIAGAFGANDPIYLLKGMSLLETLYGDRGQRRLTDLDLWVDPENRKAFHLFLVSQGYACVPERRWQATEHKWHYVKWVEGTELTLELHTSLLAKIQWSPSSGLPSKAYPGFFHLEPTENLVYLSSHLAHQHTFEQLRWLLDILLFQRQFKAELNLSKGRDLAHHLECGRAFAAVQRALSYFDPQSSHAEFLLNPSFLWHGPGWRWRYYLLKQLLKDGIFQALEYDCRWLWHGLNNRLRKSFKGD